MACGTIEYGICKPGDSVEVKGIKPTNIQTQISSIEMFKKSLDEGRAGDNVGILLKGTSAKDITRGRIITKPGAYKCVHKFEAELYALTEDEGGRHKPFFSNYKPVVRIYIYIYI